MNHTLVVVTKSPSALPEANWWKHPPVYFGLKLAYYNPCDQKLNPLTLPEDCVGFYGIEAAEPYPETVVCDLCRSQIRYILIVPVLPGEAIKMYEEGGITPLFQAATKKYIIEATAPLALVA